jgi:hypothetical protein
MNFDMKNFITPLLLLFFSLTLNAQESPKTAFFKTTPEVEKELRDVFGNNTFAIKEILQEVLYLETEESKIIISTNQYKNVMDRFLNTEYMSENHRIKEVENKKKAMGKYISVGVLIEKYNSKNN